MEAWPSRATLRRYGEVTRKYGKLLNELESVLRKGKNLLADINRLERLAMNIKALKGEKGTGAARTPCPEDVATPVVQDDCKHPLSVLSSA